MAKLTVAVLTYNRAVYLKKMLNSIKVQNAGDFIVEVYDNASTDNTAEVVSEFLSDPRFHYIRHERNIGAVGNMNAVLQNCKTEYLSLTHDDDWMMPDLIREELAVMEKDSRINLVCTECNFIDVNDRIIQNRFVELQCGVSGDIQVSQYGFIDKYMDDINFIICPTVMFRMDVIRKNNLKFRDTVGKACDTFFWIELNNCPGDFYYINVPLYNYRQHEQQDSRNWFFMRPLLRVPVYQFLKERKYPRPTVKEWVRFDDMKVPVETILEFCDDYEYIKDKLLLPLPMDTWKHFVLFLFFRIHLLYQVYYVCCVMPVKLFQRGWRKIKRMIKKWTRSQ